MSGHLRFQELVLPHLDAGYNLARWLTRDAQDAQDVVQEACLRALRYIGSMDGDRARPWFLAIVRNAFRDWCGRNRPSELVELESDALEALADPTAIDPEQAVIRGREARALADAVGELPLVFREALVLRELEDLSYKEIATVLRVPIGTVMSRLARARALLQASSRLQAAVGLTQGGAS